MTWRFYRNDGKRPWMHPTPIGWSAAGRAVGERSDGTRIGLHGAAHHGIALTYSDGAAFISYSLHQKDKIDNSKFDDDEIAAESSAKYHLEGGNLHLSLHIYCANDAFINPVDLDKIYDTLDDAVLYNALFEIIDAEKPSRSGRLKNIIKTLDIFRNKHLPRWLYDRNGVTYRTNRLTNDHLLARRVTQIWGPDGNMRDDLIPNECGR